ncbi:MAG: SRPBCC domain-containing protein [Thermodesulfobacteriota bacterium]|nr:MAG: SRPBCC domain-containing protein [Thermodesulfobacteriota bacterium]
MKIYSLERTIKLKMSMSESWDFFSNPNNLSLITPPSLNLNITSKLPDKMYTGMIITYTVAPMLNIPMTWVTEITHVEEPNFFIDEQRFGPYKFWHHQHRFKEIEGGVEAKDLVHYALPLDPLCRIANSLIVTKQLNEIFDFRSDYLENRFGIIE